MTERQSGNRPAGAGKVFLGLMLAGIAGGAVWWHLSQALNRPGPSVGEEATAGPALLAAPAEEEGWIRAAGHVEPVSQLRRLVFKTAGVIAQCRVEPGTHVKKGDVLLVLANDEQQAAVNLAHTSLLHAQAQRAKALSGAHPEEIAAAQSRLQMLKEEVRYFRTELERSRKSLAHSAVSQQEYAQAWTFWVQKRVGQMTAEAELRRLQQQIRPEDRAVADACVAQAEAQLKVAQQRLEDTVLKAPSDGTVLEVLKHEGESQRLLDSEPVLVFADCSQLCVRADVAHEHASRLAVGQQVQVGGRGLGDQVVSGRVGAIKQVLGTRKVWGQQSEERDQEVLQVRIDLDSGWWAPVGLPVEVNIHVGR